MLNCLNKIKVKSGETYLVKGGILHAIGSGCLILEIQEPTDYTIRVEKTTPSGFKIDDMMCHQGLGFRKMFECFEFERFTENEIREKCQLKEVEAIIKNGVIKKEIVTYSKTPCFNLTKLNIFGSSEIDIKNTYNNEIKL